MKKVKRVIVIEDNEGLLATFVAIIKKAGFEVDKAKNLDDSLDKIERNTYHVALVDIQLDADNVLNKDGAKIIRRLEELNEGTQTVVVSGQDNYEVAIDILQDFVISQYIIKKRFTPDSITSAINDAYAKCNIREFGAFDTLTKFLTNGKNVSQWEDKCLRFFHIGAKDLYSFLEELFAPYLPLLPLKEAAVPMDFDSENQYLTGRFWSKAIGKPISINIYPQKALQESDFSEADGSVVQKLDKFNLSGVVFDSPEYDREMF